MRPDGRIMFELMGLDHFIRKHVEARMRAMDADAQTTRMQHWVIGYLYDRIGKDVFQKDIESAFRISRSTTSSMLTLMEKKGLITRESVDYDARLKKLGLTQSAVDMHLSNIENIKKIDDIVENAITADEKAALMQIIDKIKTCVAVKLPEGDESEDNI